MPAECFFKSGETVVVESDAVESQFGIGENQSQIFERRTVRCDPGCRFQILECESVFFFQTEMIDLDNVFLVGDAGDIGVEKHIIDNNMTRVENAVALRSIGDVEIHAAVSDDDRADHKIVA